MQKPSRYLQTLTYFTRLVLFSVVGLLSPTSVAEPESQSVLNVVYPNVNENGEQQFGYAALKLALERSGRQFNLSVSNEKVNNARIRELIMHDRLSISDFGSNPDFEQELKAIYFPIDLGLNGWRLMLIHDDNKGKFSEVKSLNSLANKIAGQGIGWADTSVLEYNGLKVVQAPNLTNLFQMAQRKRFDYFPLGANEVHSLLENNKHSAPSLIVEPNLVLVYPFGRLFFVNKSNQELHDAVYLGLVKAFEDGSFIELFLNHPANKALLTKVNLPTRQKIELKNPFLTTKFNNIPPKYFYNSQMAKMHFSH